MLTRALLLAAALLAGCAAPPAATVSSLGYAAGAESKDVACGGQGTAQGVLDSAGHGVGTLRTTVTDGYGTVLHDSGPVPPEMAPKVLVGAAGLWTLRVDAGMGFSGEFAVTLRC
jgi:hypothetical protein